MQLVIWCLIFLISLLALLIGADILTKHSEKLGHILKIPQFIIGITIVSIGTSLPELLTGVMAILKGKPEFVAANVLGSNIANIFIFIGISTLLLKKVDFKKDNIGHDLLILGGATASTILMILDGKLVLYEAILLLVIYGGYGVYKFINRASWLETVKESLIAEERLSWKTPAFILLGAVGIYFGAEYIIESVFKIAELTKVNSTFLIFTAVAIGTSLPELVVSILTAIKGNFGMSLGNIFGSNFFNTTMILGISGLFGTLPISPTTIKIGIPFLIVATYLFTSSAAHKKSFGFDEGIVCLVLYGIFIVQLFVTSQNII